MHMLCTCMGKMTRFFSVPTTQALLYEARASSSYQARQTEVNNDSEVNVGAPLVEYTVNPRGTQDFT